MNISDEQKRVIEEQKKQCVYCKIVKGEIPGKKFFDDDKTLAILDIYPAIKGHSAFLFKEHYPLPAFIPADEFKHFFGLVPGLSKALKDSIITTGINLFLASGGAAGQQFPHTGVHFFPRERGDGFFNFMFKKNVSTDEKSAEMLANNLPIMMQNHFSRNPASWHQGKGNVPGYLTPIYESEKVIYEDEKVLVVLPKEGAIEGHLEIYSKVEEKYIENLSAEDSAHLFFTASFAATAVFEGLGAHGTNIVMQSGESDDYPDGKLVLHVLPRKQEDALQHLFWKPEQPKSDLDALASKIKDKTWKLTYKEKEMKSTFVVPPVMKLGSNGTKKSESKKFLNPEEEIREAIERMRG